MIRTEATEHDAAPHTRVDYNLEHTTQKTPIAHHEPLALLSTDYRPAMLKNSTPANRSMTSRVLPQPLTIVAWLVCAIPFILGEQGMGQQLSSGQWKRNGLASERFTISGTGGRNNPLRKSLQSPFDGSELFVRFNLRYHLKSLDSPPETSGEFFVLWLDEHEGNDGSPHAANIPNIGIHVQGDQNRFMIRYNSATQKFAEPIKGDQDYAVVGRLWKSTPEKEQSFDQLSLWIDPSGTEESKPDISVQNHASISTIKWIGFSTGAKTEIEDLIEVWDVQTANSWREIMNLPIEMADPNYAPEMEKPPAKKTISFRKHIHPILAKHCFNCHAGKEAKDGIRLDTIDEVLQHISPLRHAESRLFQLVTSEQMPPEGEKLSESELQKLATWIDEGLDWDSNLLPAPKPVSEHWAFQPITRPSIPSLIATKNSLAPASFTHASGWVRNPIDAFIAAKQAEAGLIPNPPADQATLQRRFSLTLHGLPAEPDSPTEASDIQHLLSTPAYGQHFARHWLDIARWAESNGHQHNRDRQHAWRYRDWVITAFASGMPFDQFLREQIAGDELADSTPSQLVATGFLAAARYSGNELDKQIQRNDILLDITNTTASAFLGLTFECAQCHSHKFDPISIRDYYRFQAFFVSGQPQNLLMENDETSTRIAQQRWNLFKDVEQRLLTVRRKLGYPEPILVTPANVIAQMRSAEKNTFKRLNDKLSKLEQTWSFYSPSTASQRLTVAPHEMRWQLPHDPALLGKLRAAILIRGDLRSRGPEVSAGWPLIFGDPPTENQTRQDLAKWLTDAQNPLTARVWVNRIWQWHFGRGLVETSNDFGTQGQPPSHPKLLDFLASELIEHAWDTQHIQRLILTSSTYQLSNQETEKSSNIDPENRLYWRWTPHRLQAEAIRDSILKVSGQLDHRDRGPSDSHDSQRRSIYLTQKRDNLPEQQVLFDSANGIITCARRRTSTTALQPLWLLNSKFAQTAAQKFAERAGNVETAIQIALHRKASPDELQLLGQLAEAHGLSSACLAILNSSEFLYIP